MLVRRVAVLSLALAFAAACTRTQPDAPETRVLAAALGDQPVAVDDAVSMNEDSNVFIDVLFNDSGLFDTPILVGISGDGPVNGFIDGIYSNEIAYIPFSDFHGTDSFDYFVMDVDGDTDVGTVTVTVDPVDDVPVCSNGFASTNEDESVDLVVSCTLGDTPAVIAESYADSCSLVFTGGFGVRVVPDPDFSGSAFFEVAVSDADGQTSYAQYEVFVFSVDDVPLLADDVLTVDEDVLSVLPVFVNDTGLGDGIALVTTTEPEHGTVFNDGSAISYLADPDYSGPDSFTYSVQDFDGQSDSATVTLTVLAVNDIPDPQPDGVHLGGGGTAFVSVLANDRGLGEGGITLSIETPPSAGSAVAGATGITYTAPATPGTYTFEYAVQDADSDMGVGLVTVVVHPALQDAVSPLVQTVGEGGVAVFNGRVTLRSGGRPTRAAWDFDDDGTDDTILCDEDGGTAAPPCALASAGNLFEGEDVYGGGSLDVFVGDADGDGIPDAITAGLTRLHRGDGFGGFLPAELLGGNLTRRVALGDVTGDGIDDLIALEPTDGFAEDNLDNDGDESIDEPDEGRPTALVVRAGTGGGSFPVETYRVPIGDGTTFGGDSFSFAAADIDDDGDVDLAYALSSLFDPVFHLLRSEPGALVPDATFSAFVPMGVAFHDLDGDDAPDLVLTDATGMLQILSNDGVGSFSLQTDIELEGVFTRFAFGDRDADGDDDLALASPSDLFVPGFPIDRITAIVTLDGTSVAGTVDIPEVGGALALGDLDGDDRAELVARDGTNTVVVFGADLESRVPHHFAHGAGSEGLALADLDGDQNLDLLAIENGTLGVLRGAGRGDLGVKRNYAPANGGEVADFDGDGYADVVGASPFRLLRGDGLRGFGPPAAIGEDSESKFDVVSADLDGDGDRDLAAQNGLAGVEIWLNDGGGAFALDDTIVIGDDGRIYAGDLDGDGALDLVVYSFSQIFYALLNDGDGAFTQGGTHFVETLAYELVLQDLTADGRADIVWTGSAERSDPELGFITGGLVSVSKTGAGGVLGGDGEEDLFFDAGDVYGTLGRGDFDGDGTADVVAVGSANMRVFLSDVAGGVASIVTTTYAQTFNEAYVAIGDLDGDGAADIATLDPVRTAAVVRLGDGTGRVGAASRAGLSSVAESWIADLDGDGRQELVYAGPNTAVIEPATIRWSLDVSAVSPPYPNPGDYVARLTLDAESAGPFEITRDVEVLEAFPVAGTIISDGQPVERVASLLRVPVIVSVEDALTSCVWSFDDGSPDFTDLGCAGFTGSDFITTEHAFPDGDPTIYDVTVTLYDEDGFSVGSGPIYVVNGRPSVVLSAPPVVTEGVPAVFTATITDSPDAHWRGDWEDQFPAPTPIASDVSATPSIQRTFTFSQQTGLEIFGITVEDQTTAAGVPDGSSLSTSASITFAVADHAPQIGVIGSTANPSAEAQSVTFSASVTAVAADPISSCSWSFGDGSAPVPDPACTPGSLSASPSASHVFTDGDPTGYVVTLSVTDEDGTATRTLVQTVQNGAPTIAIDSILPASTGEGSAVTASVTITDPAGNADPFFRLVWSWGDGTTETTVVASTGAASRSHTYTDEGSYPVSVTVTDQTDNLGNPSAGSLSDSDAGAATVVNAAPALATMASPQAASEGQVFLAQAVATDPGADTLVYSLTAAPAGMSILPGNGVIVWSPSYLQSGSAPGLSHTVTVQVADGDGGTDSETFTVRSVWRDDDGDGMADTWELANGLDPTQDDASGDADGDGISNLDEFLAGSSGGGHPPSSITLLTPADGATVTLADPSFTTTVATDPDGGPLTYRVQIAADAGFTSVLVTGTAAGTTISASGAALVDDTTYFWRARAADAGGLAGPWSAPRSFFYTPVNDAPVAPGVIAPADGSQVASLTPALIVAGAVDADHDELALTFRFQVWDDAALTDPPVADSGTLAATPGGVQVWTVDTTLAEDTSYWWTVTVTDPGTAATESAASTFRVNLGNAEPGAPIAVSPLDGASVAFAPLLTVTNAVDPDGDALEYLFEIDSTPAFDSPDYESSGWIAEGTPETTYTPSSTLVENRIYVWRARATDHLSTSDVASGSFRMNAANDPPTAAVLLSPVDGERIVGDELTTVTFANGVDPEEGALTARVRIWEGDVAGADADAIFDESDAVPAGAAFTSKTIEAGIKFKGSYVVVVTHADPLGVTSAPATARVTIKNAGGGGGGGGCSVAGTRTTGAAAMLLLPLLGAWIARRRRAA